MQDNDNPSNNPIPESRRPYWSDEHQCYLVPLTRGHFAKVDAEDIPVVEGRLWRAAKWRSGWYAVRSVNRSTIPMHRAIMHPLEVMVVDHINGNGLDNRRDNLRIATASQNLMNRRGAQAGNRSGYIGVHWHKATGKWRAAVKTAGASVDVGFFEDKEAAAHARDSAAIEMHGEFASLNFPRQEEER